jgi:DNA-binding MarR family transcriptional regulator
VRDRSKSVKDGLPHGENVLFSVWLVARAAESLLHAALTPAGLDADEFAIYSVLNSAETVTPTELAGWMAAPPTTVSSYVKRFEARGHVVRERNPADGRSYRLRLTDTGRAAHRAAGERFLPALADVEAHLGAAEPEVRAALLALRDAIDRVRRR